MELGEKLRQARLEAGLSQRQLCQDIVTRNMLSQIENGSAHPSMATLQAFAERLGKTVSYFLEEQAVVSPNVICMEHARRAWKQENFREALHHLKNFQSPDPVFGDEKDLLYILCSLGLAQSVLEQGKIRYAGEILEKIQETVAACPYGKELERRRLLLLGRTMPAEKVVPKLPSLDEELMLRCQLELDRGNISKAQAYLNCIQEKSGENWDFLWGKLQYLQKNYRAAADSLRNVRDSRQVYAMLEVCYRELGDFQKAYEYACKQR